MDGTSPRRPAPARNPDRVVVAADGSADFCTVQGAVDQIEPHRTQPATIFIRKGRYEELVRVGRERRHVHLVGEDRKGTVIACTNNERLNPGWIQRAVLGVEGDDFVLENLTVQNTTPYKGSQAEAVSINAERCVLRNADFLSFQDTLNLSGRVYVADCYIEGDVDYVWGYGTACFERCELRSMHDGYHRAGAQPGWAVPAMSSSTASSRPRQTCKSAGSRASRPRGSPRAMLPSSAARWVCTPARRLAVDRTGERSGLRFEEFASTDLDGNPLDLSQRRRRREKNHR